MNQEQQYIGQETQERHHKIFESRSINNLHQVGEIKKRAAILLAEIDGISVPPGNTEAGRLITLAKTDLESSVMWAVKAISRY